mmetsp:Transcript_1236/g.2756  ORF Transcript_1236/g.2756 Transcript_1236/m.2756 type:complete len:570 (-) Transcript_1236:372-2081(-)
MRGPTNPGTIFLLALLCIKSGSTNQGVLSELRLIDDNFEATLDRLSKDYTRLSIGGATIVEDYEMLECMRAVNTFRDTYHITDPLVSVKTSEQPSIVGVFWSKSSEVQEFAPSSQQGTTSTSFVAQPDGRISRPKLNADVNLDLLGPEAIKALQNYQPYYDIPFDPPPPGPVAKSDFVIVIDVTAAYFELFMNCVQSWRYLGFSKFLVAAQDVETEQRAKALGFTTVLLSHMYQSGRDYARNVCKMESTTHTFEYQWLRRHLVVDLVFKGLAFWFSDADTAMVSDPTTDLLAGLAQLVFAAEMVLIERGGVDATHYPLYLDNPSARVSLNLFLAGYYPTRELRTLIAHLHYDLHYNATCLVWNCQIAHTGELYAMGLRLRQQVVEAPYWGEVGGVTVQSYPAFGSNDGPEIKEQAVLYHALGLQYGNPKNRGNVPIGKTLWLMCSDQWFLVPSWQAVSADGLSLDEWLGRIDATVQYNHHQNIDVKFWQYTEPTTGSVWVTLFSTLTTSDVFGFVPVGVRAEVDGELAGESADSCGLLKFPHRGVPITVNITVVLDNGSSLPGFFAQLM